MIRKLKLQERIIPYCEKNLQVRASIKKVKLNIKGVSKTCKANLEYCGGSRFSPQLWRHRPDDQIFKLINQLRSFQNF